MKSIKTHLRTPHTRSLALALSLLMLLTPLLTVLTSCRQQSPAQPVGSEGITDENEISLPTPDLSQRQCQLIRAEGDTFCYQDSESGGEFVLTVSCLSGEGTVAADDTGLSLTVLSEDAHYVLDGELYGALSVHSQQQANLELTLCGLTVTSRTAPPLTATGLSRLTLTAKRGTENRLYDIRSAGQLSRGAVVCDGDLTLGGRGSLTVISTENNGIHTKDDLRVKNLTLTVSCLDNALKGNDGVEISSGTLTLIARQGDGIKTGNTSLSQQGRQKGCVHLTGGTLLIYAACDGIDAACDVTLSEEDGALSLQIFTDRYSRFSEQVSDDRQTLYIRCTDTAWRPAVRFTGGEGEALWVTAGEPERRGAWLYYPIERPSGYTDMQLFLYTGAQTPGQDNDYASASGVFALQEGYDTVSVRAGSDGSLRLSWSHYESGLGQDGNEEKSAYSTKGIKAGSSLCVSGGTAHVCSRDDALHASNTGTLQSGATPTGSLRVIGGSLTLYTDDDALHADGELTVEDGQLTVLSCYEGLEGERVSINDGRIAICARDDGINATATAGTGIVIRGGQISVLAAGDGLDANTREPMGGVHFLGGCCLIVCTGQADSAIDTECGYTYGGGSVLAIGNSGGMNESETTHLTPALSTCGTRVDLRLSAPAFLRVEGLPGIVGVYLSGGMQLCAVCLGSTAVSLSTDSTAPTERDVTGAVFAS